MTRIKRYFCAAVFLMAFLPVNISAASGAGTDRVYDDYHVLSEEEEVALNQELEEIYDTCGFEAVILTSEDVQEEERMYAAKFMQEHEIGYGENKDGMCLFHQPGKRNIAIVFRGEAQEAFDTGIQDILLDDCTEYLKEDDPYGAYQVVLKDLKGGLLRWSSGKSVRPMDVGGGIIGFALAAFFISLTVSAVPVFFMVMYQKGKMKTIRQKPDADDYIEKDSISLDVERDIYVRTVTTRTQLPKDDDHYSSGGSSGSFTSGGESFSGSSRSY